MITRPLLFAACIFTASCSVSRAVKPLPKGSGAMQLSMGGPISKDLPTPVPFIVPITTVGYAHGVTERTSVHGAVHPTGLAAFGIFAMDVGATTLLMEADGARPRLMLDGDLVFATGNNAPGEPIGGTRLFPNADLIAAWDLGPHAVYGGFNQLIQPFPVFRYHVTPQLGALLSTGRVDFQFEYKWMAPTSNNLITAAEFVGPVGLGASSIQLGLGIRLGKQEAQ